MLQTSCVSGRGRHYVLEEGYAGRGVERALIAPVNLVPGLPVGFVGETDAVMDAITDYLGSHGIAAAAADEEESRALWERCREETRLPDGEPDEPIAAICFVRRLRERAPFDVLVVPTLIYREVRLRPLPAPATLPHRWEPCGFMEEQPRCGMTYWYWPSCCTRRSAAPRRGPSGSWPELWDWCCAWCSPSRFRQRPAPTCTWSRRKDP